MDNLEIIYAVIKTLDGLSFPVSVIRKSGDAAAAIAGCVNALEEYCKKQEAKNGE